MLSLFTFHVSLFTSHGTPYSSFITHLSLCHILSLPAPPFVTVKTCIAYVPGANLPMIEILLLTCYAQKKCIAHPHYTGNTAVDSIGDMVV
jgi:hypothetical protein